MADEYDPFFGTEEVSAPSTVTPQTTEEAAIRALEVEAERESRRAENKRKREQKKAKKKQQKDDPTALAPGTKIENERDIYVSGLPTSADMTMAELAQWFSICGIIRNDEANSPKVRLYRSPDGSLKGDGIICFLKKESVELAMQLRDGAEIRPGFPVKVSRAVYEAKAGFVPRKRQKKKGSRAAAGDQAKELGWGDDDDQQQQQGNVHAVLRGMFTLDDTLAEPNFIRELREDVMAEASKMGEVVSVVVFENNPEGIVTVKFRDPDSADRCIKV